MGSRPLQHKRDYHETVSQTIFILHISRTDGSGPLYDLFHQCTCPKAPITIMHRPNRRSNNHTHSTIRKRVHCSVKPPEYDREHIPHQQPRYYSVYHRLLSFVLSDSRSSVEHVQNAVGRLSSASEMTYASIRFHVRRFHCIVYQRMRAVRRQRGKVQGLFLGYNHG
jgi:hypothetical protein